MFLDDLRATNPALAEAYALVGNQPLWALRAMVRALGFHAWSNTAEDCARLAAAKYILRNARKAPK